MGYQCQNFMLNNKGFSPVQIVLGCKPNLPTTMLNEAPANETDGIPQSVQKHLDAMSFARKAFVEAESSEKIK